MKQTETLFLFENRKKNEMSNKMLPRRLNVGFCRAYFTTNCKFLFRRDLLCE